MKLTVLGASGAFPTSTEPCSGFLVEHRGFRVALDLGHATFPSLLNHIRADELDAVLITHGHSDHCADLNPLLRARALTEPPAPALPVHAPAGALNAVLALDAPHLLAGAIALTDLRAGERLRLGPFTVDTAALPHFVPNLGIRLSTKDYSLVCTGDAGPSEALVDLARDADLLIAEATHPDHVPDADAAHLSSARQAAEQAKRAGVRHLVLSHLWPGTDPERARRSAAEHFPGPIDVARRDLVIDLD